MITMLIFFSKISSLLSPNFIQLKHTLDPKWERYACGKTKDQLFMTQLAHMIFKKTTLQPRSLNFFKN